MHISVSQTIKIYNWNNTFEQSPQQNKYHLTTTAFYINNEHIMVQHNNDIWLIKRTRHIKNIKGNPCFAPEQDTSNKVQYNHAYEKKCSLQLIWPHGFTLYHRSLSFFVPSITNEKRSFNYCFFVNTAKPLKSTIFWRLLHHEKITNTMKPICHTTWDVFPDNQATVCLQTHSR